ncbi:MAG: UUP1 family membrane protein [Deltaproteobacteria bacterium]|nr:UUP1 family membrane protein [Deltaproteobacteria bacterium]
MRLFTASPNQRRTVYFSLVAFLVFFPLGIMAYKLFVLDYPLAGLIPAVSYSTDVTMQVTGHGDDMMLRTYLPRSDFRQTVTEEANASGAFTLTFENDGLNRVGVWRGERVTGTHTLHYTYTAQGTHVRYVIPDHLEIPQVYPAGLKEYLASEEGVPVSDPLIAQTTAQLFPKGKPTILEAVTTIHRFLQDQFANRDFSGYTDALTALKLREASCNGKSRLFVALARKMNLPARLVGGVVMESGSKRTSHQWVEVYVNGHWVPFDTINNHYMELPANFLTLYYGDQVLFRHSTNVNFQYHFNMNKRLVPKREVQNKLRDSVLNIFNLYDVFQRIGISANLLKIILMIPFGALVVVIFRNVVGMETFGTFLPALIASAARETGLVWGLLAFFTIILVCSFVRRALDWLHLLHSPKMGIMLTLVVLIILGLTVLGVNLSLFDLAHVSLFPIAIMAITAERFAIMEAEQGLGKAMKIMLATLVVITACYVVMDSLFLQSLVLAFQELLLVLIALNLWLGKWVGMRLTEFLRFRYLILRGEEVK